VLIRLDPSAPEPIYAQIAAQVRSAAARGELEPGERLPAARDLAESLQVNLHTVLRAYQELERDALTETRRGQGTFITRDADRVAEIRRKLAEQAVNDFLDKMRSLGLTRDEIMRLLEERGG